ncbi:hypothetical protein CPAR01_13342 [Colletotrichum paranaense]|uniref:Uncharacterized protein n=1 Tax=Colletotrichum paranaense TaxID=1914294 RepID=A0ABQ9S5Q4_9PEZI|nr:uncharacterized protein CPAR01_13342 [Colletotrichum paranaense]KAK1526814.1 hypothetical protein CPAR01_13342 [Colletotrichum paranaense]
MFHGSLVSPLLSQSPIFQVEVIPRDQKTGFPGCKAIPAQCPLGFPKVPVFLPPAAAAAASRPSALRCLVLPSIALCSPCSPELSPNCPAGLDRLPASVIIALPAYLTATSRHLQPTTAKRSRYISTRPAAPGQPSIQTSKPSTRRLTSSNQPFLSPIQLSISIPKSQSNHFPTPHPVPSPLLFACLASAVASTLAALSPHPFLALFSGCDTTKTTFYTTIASPPIRNHAHQRNPSRLASRRPKTSLDISPPIVSLASLSRCILSAKKTTTTTTTTTKHSREANRP